MTHASLLKHCRSQHWEVTPVADPVAEAFAAKAAPGVVLFWRKDKTSGELIGRPSVIGRDSKARPAKDTQQINYLVQS